MPFLLGHEPVPKDYYDKLFDPATRDPRGYIIPSDQPDFLTATKFVNALIKTGIEIHRATSSFEVSGKSYPAGSYVIQAAQASETSVHVTITLFDTAAIAQLCGSATNRATAIDNIITEMEAGGADGVSIDFETPDTATRDNFTLFISELRSELDARGHPDAEIAIAGPAWSGIGAS